MQLSSLLYFLTCIFGWGGSTFIMGYLAKVMRFETAVTYQLFGTIFLSLFYFRDFEWISPWYMFLATLNGFLFTLADIAYYKLSQSGMDVSILGPLSSMFAAVPVVLGILILREPVSPRKFIGVVLALTAIYILSSEEHSAVEPPTKPKDEEV